MPKIDFSHVDGIADFAPLPDGEYTCRLSDVEADFTRAGDVMWKVRLTVESGDLTGRLLFDNLVFSPKALPRVKLVCASCGLDVSGVLDLEPPMLLEKQVRVTTFVEEYTDDHGVAKARNRIPFDGYAAVAAVGAESCPF